MQKAAEGKSVRIDSDTDLLALQQRLRAKLDELYPVVKEGDSIPWRDFVLTTPTYFVYHTKGEHFKIEYTDVQGNLSVGAPSKVKPEYVAAESLEGQKITGKFSESFSGTLTAEQLTEKGWKWKVRLLESGPALSANANLAPYGLPGKMGRRDYSAEAIAQAVGEKLFEGAPFVIRSEQEHLETANGGQTKLNPNDEVRRVGGTFHDSYTATTSKGVAAEAILNLRRNDAGKAAREFLLKQAAEAEIPYEVSWTGDFEGELVNPSAHEPTIKVHRITQVDSIDPCLKGNAGGKILQAAESAVSPKHTMKKDKTYNTALALLRLKAAEADVEGAADGPVASLVDYAAKEVFEKLPGAKDIYDSVDDVKALPEEKLVKLFAKAVGTQAAPVEEKPVEEMAAAETVKPQDNKRLSDLEKKLEEVSRKNIDNYLRRAVAESGLPEKHKTHVLTAFKDRTATESEIDVFVRQTKDLAAEANPTMFADPKVKADERDKMHQAVMNFMFQNAPMESRKVAEAELGYDPGNRKYQSFTSFKEMYQAVNGIRKLGLGFGLDERGRASEAYHADITTELLTDAISMRLKSDYASLIQFDDWRKIGTPVTVNDFRSLNTFNYGYVGGLSTKVAGSDFEEISLEGDEQTTLSMTNRGNLFSITWDDVINDNVGHIQKIPGKLARGAKRELYEAVFDLLWNAFSTNYESDSTAIIHTDHYNTHATPATLSATTVKRGRQAMMKQRELGTNKVMGIAPKYLIHQTKDWEDAYAITTPAAGESNIVATAEQSLRLESIEVPHWADTFDRWFLKSSEQDVESINVAFYQGKQEPEITQEAAGTGANFTAMKLRYRIHFPWACKVVDFRGIYGEKVS